MSTNLDSFISSQLDVDDELAPGFTIKWILGIMLEKDAEFRSILDGRKIEKISSEDITQERGYCSVIYKIRVYTSDSSEPCYSFVLKVPRAGGMQSFHEYADTEEISRDSRQEVIQMHATECDAYDILKDIKDFPLPLVYFSRKHVSEDRPGVLIMEDLTRRGVHMEIHTGGSKQLCLNFVRNFAIFQAYCDTIPEEKWRNRFVRSYHVDELNLRGTWPKMIQKTIDKTDGELKENFRKFIEVDFCGLSIYVNVELPRKYNALTLCHGDIWVNNFMISKDDPDRLSAILDWQVLLEANPLYDIARFLTSCTDPDVQKELDPIIVDVYYDCLERKLEEDGKKPRFSREQAHNLYANAFVIQVPCLAIMLGLRGFPLKASGKEEEFRRIYERIEHVANRAIEKEKSLGLFEKFALK